MRRFVPLGAVAGGIALAAVSALPASALWVSPSNAPMKDASGATNGCTVDVAPFGLGEFPGVEGPGVYPKVQMTCPDSADVHRVRFKPSMYEVMDDGTLRRLTGGSALVASEAAINSSGSGAFTPCSASLAGDHTYLFRARVTAKRTFTHVDPNPSVAKVARLQTVTCP